MKETGWLGKLWCAVWRGHRFLPEKVTSEMGVPMAKQRCVRCGEHRWLTIEGTRWKG